MKIKSSAELPTYFNRVEEKEDTNKDFEQNLGREQRKKEEEQEKDTHRVTDEKVSRAIQDFSVDSMAKANQLSAQKVGSGPGLKVVLKDKSGAVIRQLSGEEFLKLREAVADAGKSGKILDQKL